jgi:hypothetical protein
MDRRVLVVFIAIMSALVVLLMVHFNQQAIAPTPEPTVKANGIVKPLFTDMTNVTQKNTTSMANLTSTPTPSPPARQTTPTYQRISTPTTAPTTLTPTPLPSGMTPWTAWGRMAAATPMAPASWNDTLWIKKS